MTKKEKRENLAKSDFCRSFLYVQGFLSDSENEKVHQRIRKWQDKHKVGVTMRQLLSVEITYDDNVKGDEDND